MHSVFAWVVLCVMIPRLSLSLVLRVSRVPVRSDVKLMSTSAVAGPINFYGSSKEDLTTLLTSWGQPSYRVKQINEWVFDKGVTDFDLMTGLPKDLRAKLKEFYSVGNLKLVSEQVSKDGTKKRAYELRDGQIIESVLMPYDDGRRTACISSQAGCGMGCVFCATGQMGFSRQLSSAEIFEQAQIFSTELKRRNERLSNVVFMGMGEPMANYDNVMVAVRRLNTDLGIGARHITISTVGLAPRIRKLAEEDIQVNLAVSLHQANDAKRSALMPVNKRYPLPELLDACRFYIEKTNRRISFEWALIRDDTDTEETARELGRLLRGMLCHVNVIPLNPTANFGGKPTSKVSVWCGWLRLRRHGQRVPLLCELYLYLRSVYDVSHHFRIVVCHRRECSSSSTYWASTESPPRRV
jgi:23S rRNA (adenine2503-C2)-methyltransferase